MLENNPIAGVVGGYRGLSENLKFKGPDITGGTLWSGDSSLVCRGSGAIIGVIDSQAARQQRVGRAYLPSNRLLQLGSTRLSVCTIYVWPLFKDKV